MVAACAVIVIAVGSRDIGQSCGDATGREGPKSRSPYTEDNSSTSPGESRRWAVATAKEMGAV